MDDRIRDRGRQGVLLSAHADFEVRMPQKWAENLVSPLKLHELFRLVRGGEIGCFMPRSDIVWQLGYFFGIA